MTLCGELQKAGNLDWDSRPFAVFFYSNFIVFLLHKEENGSNI